MSGYGHKITVPVSIGKCTQKVLDAVNSSMEIFALWEVTGVVANKRLRMTDHGVKHFQIVIGNALLMLDILRSQRVRTSAERDYRLSYDYAQTIVLLSAMLHDIGMSVNREGHEEYSLFLASDMVNRLLSFADSRHRVIIRSEVLHAIICHRKLGRPLTLEAGIVRVADALDMTRSRVDEDVDDNMLDIHEVSAQAIDEVEIKQGKKKPVQINIVMNHTAGLFQVDELMNKKLQGSGIQKYLDVIVYMEKKGKRQLFKQYLGS